MILDNLDEDETCDKAKRLLKNYRRLRRIAGRKLTVLQSPAMTGMPHSQSIDNNNEHRIQERLIAEEEVPAILRAVASLDEVSQTIINEQYIRDNISNVEMAYELHMAKSTFDRTKKDAIIMFAESFNYEELMVFN
ncbi:hypothetical protein AYR55_03835 [Loigolactobacillus backii]|uniref:ArpU family phage packaging/lysis transcriptional regulator n=1 Tax=Loigolactobacillus backii TaxID=375175 RepID=UPI0007F184CB|nr:ArpU family phage packaging/lysis transcriptional regulator [Loigolactobacillus backii]ANK66909.1 hypothetical protein AYR55_03835 [Loigolactobacillus backii]